MKIIIALVVLVVVVAGAWWLFGMGQPTNAPAVPVAGTSGTANQAGGNQPATGAAATNGGTSVAITTGSGDADLNQDLANINAQMNNFSADSASIDQSMNDQPVTQSQL